MRCKNIIVAFTVIAIAGMASSCSRQGNDADPNVLLPQITLGSFVDAQTPLSEIIGDYRLIPLETTDESLIGGRTNKIIKKDGHIFVRSNNEVLMFGENGNFQDKLSRVGGGPEEYESLFDYDIVPEYDEIWVSSNRGIVRYKYPSMEFSGTIPLKFFANSFKYLGNDTFIAYTPEDIVYKVVSMDGKVLNEYFEKDLANSTTFPVQFVRIDNCIATQLGDSNSAVCYVTDSASFKIKDILSPKNDQLATTEINRKYYDLYGYFDFTSKVRQDYATVGWFRKIGNQALVFMLNPGDERSIIVDNGSTVKEYKVWPEDKNVIKNDICDTPDVPYLVTFGSCDSDDSFIFILPNDDEEANPTLLEVKKLK